MATASKVCDVYISHALRDAELAKEVAASVRAVGFESAASMDFAAADDALWDALAECRAFVTIVSPSGLTASTGFELGAAQGWNKPIFAVITESSAKTPTALARATLYPPARIDDIVRAIQAVGEPLSDEDCQTLAEVYDSMQMPLDKLVLEPWQADKLVQRFKVHSHRSLSGERLLSELLRMRKLGVLKHRPRRKTT